MTDMDRKIDGKIVVVTGGAQGLGLAIVHSFLQYGAKLVIILDINEEYGKKAISTLAPNFPNKAVFYKCNVVSDLDDTYDLIIKNHQRVDVLINNAGVIDETNIRKTIDVNVTAVMEWSMKFYEHMRIDKGGGGGTIINMSSIYGHRITALFAYYHASKFAVNGFSKSMGHEINFKRTGVRVLALCPGMTMTHFVVKPRVREQDLFEEFIADIETSYEWQKAEDVSAATVQTFEKGESGTIWLVEGARPATKWDV